MTASVFSNKQTNSTTVRLCLFSPLPPPSGGIATWSSAILGVSADHGQILVFHIDSAVRWRSTNDLSLWKRIFGGAFQAIVDIFRVYVSLNKSKPHLLQICSSASLANVKDILVLLLARLLRVRTILHYHMGRLPEIIAGNTWEWKFIRCAMKLADTVLLLDRKSEDSVTKALPGLSVRRIPNPIDLRIVEEVLSEEKKIIETCGLYRIVYAGHVIPAKGISELVKACLLIEGYELELHIIGTVECDFRRELERLAAQRKSGEWLRFYGAVERREAMGYIRDAHIFVLPSYTEGFPNVILEAMALGKAIIATDVGAIPEMLADGCGVLVTPRDVEGLAVALRRLIANEDERIVMGELARTRALAEFSLKSVFASYLTFWRNAAGLPDQETSGEIVQ